MTFGHGPMEQVFLGRDISRDRNYSEQVAASIDQEMKGMITEAYNKAEEIIRTHREKLDAIVEALLEKETLEAADFERLLASGEDPEIPQAVDAQAVEESSPAGQGG
jgi:cell division protease FtsH